MSRGMAEVLILDRRDIEARADFLSVFSKFRLSILNNEMAASSLRDGGHIASASGLKFVI